MVIASKITINTVARLESSKSIDKVEYLDRDIFLYKPLYCQYARIFIVNMLVMKIVANVFRFIIIPSDGGTHPLLDI